MRRLSLVLAAAFVVACAPTGTPTQEPVDTTNANPNATPSTAASTAPAPLKDAARLYIDGQMVTNFGETPSIAMHGVGVKGDLTITHGNTNKDRSYYGDFLLNKLSDRKGIPEDFKPEDIERITATWRQYLLGQATGNKWTKVVDVPSSKVKSSFTHDGDHFSGWFELTLEADPGNEAEYKKDILVRYEFDGEIDR